MFNQLVTNRRLQLSRQFDKNTNDFSGDYLDNIQSITLTKLTASVFCITTKQ